MLKHNIDHHILSRLIEFLKSCQKETGGFGGSPQHYAHLATTYASIMALVSIGTEEALAVINRFDFYVDTHIGLLKAPLKVVFLVSKA